MLFPITFSGEFLSTNLTVERLFTCVNFEMVIQIAYCCAFLSTQVAFERFFSSMSIEMVFQVVPYIKSFVTIFTLVRFFVTVNSFMDIQMIFSTEAAITYCTFEGLIFLANQIVAFGMDFFLGSQAFLIIFSHLINCSFFTKLIMVGLSWRLCRNLETTHATFSWISVTSLWSSYHTSY